ncbi:hypothetical protein IB277_13520 [Ensifer sp. ENS07]|uniref:hypothetical protein n=1 Tax=unclassified Ensifer TaxID=2633371 RepID=UPI001780068B|nr:MULTISPECIES: hypothetical protein [unclassified Ensifer]MBD9508183.1 hypothetical protein [Ensifer sp. ENS10]MBD9637325.1 hypothetical protein [Ensifer sp. ENS07]
MGTYDLYLKNLFDDDGEEIIRNLFGEEVTKQENTDLLLGVPRFADDWYQLEGDNRFLHLEFQSTNDYTMGWRMANYRAAMAFKKVGWRKPFDLRQVAIYFGNDPLRMSRKISEHRLSFGYEVYDIRELPHPQFDIHNHAFNVNLMTLLGEATPRLRNWQSLISQACFLPDETLRS